MPTKFLFTTLFDPRGRCDRRGLLLAAALLLALQGAVLGAAGAALITRDGPVAVAIDALLIWSAIAVTAKRLHDAGLSAWWIGKAFLAIVLSTIVLAIALMRVLPDAAFEAGRLGYVIILAGNMLPVFGLCLWMHFVKGQAGANPFGPSPGASGFSMPETGTWRASLSRTGPLRAASR